MKRYVIGFFSCVGVAFAQPVLNVYQWSNSIPHSVYKAFTDQTGIAVNVSSYDSNESLYAKLKGNPDLSYDVVFPSSYFVKRMIGAHLLQPIASKVVTNAQYVYPRLMRQSFDPDNTYTYPFMWGMTGIAVNDRYIPVKQITGWESLWSPRYRHQILWLNDVREVFSMALIRLGYSINDRNPSHIKEAYHLLRKALPNVKVINADAMASMFIDEDVTLGLAWSLDTYQASLGNSHVHFIIPPGRYAMWLDCMAIAKGSKHPRLAAKLINFLLSEKAARAITKEMGYATPNKKAADAIALEQHLPEYIHPGPSTFARGEIEGDVGDKARALYEQYWFKLRLSV